MISLPVGFISHSEISVQNSTKVIYTLLRKEKGINFATNTKKAFEKI